MCEAATMGARHVQGSYKGCEACARQLQGVRGMCKAATSGCEACARQPYKGCEAHVPVSAACKACKLV